MGLASALYGSRPFAPGAGWVGRGRKPDSLRAVIDPDNAIHRLIWNEAERTGEALAAAGQPHMTAGPFR